MANVAVWFWLTYIVAGDNAVDIAIVIPAQAVSWTVLSDVYRPDPLKNMFFTSRGSNVKYIPSAAGTYGSEPLMISL